MKKTIQQNWKFSK